jgi:hypothetical protein
MTPEPGEGEKAAAYGVEWKIMTQKPPTPSPPYVDLHIKSLV